MGDIRAIVTSSDGHGHRDGSHGAVTIMLERGRERERDEGRETRGQTERQTETEIPEGREAPLLALP